MPLTVTRVPIDSVHQDPANPRKHEERSIEAIKSSLARFSQQKPVVVDRNGIVRAGNGTYLAAKALGWTEIDVVVTDLEGIEATAYAIADNRTTELSAWDDEVFPDLWRELEEAGATDGLGFEPEDLVEYGVGVDHTDAPTLASDPGMPKFIQITFVVTEDQREKVDAAIKAAKEAGPFASDNENSNGNALERIAEAYLG
jgi:hypothetical protein